MKYSIRKQFTVAFVGMMTLAVAFCWLLNILFLEKYYTKEKQKRLLEVYSSINESISDGSWKTQEYRDVVLMNLCSKYGIDGIVVDIRTQTITAFGTDEKQSHRQLWDNLIFVDRNSENYLLKTDQYQMMITKDQTTKTDYVELWGNLNNGDIFLLRTALESIRESVAISNRFLAYIGISSAILSSIMIGVLTRKYTKPIMDLVNISERMAKLDFEAKYQGSLENEIGILGENINYMSFELEKTISELKTANIELTKDIKNKEKLEEMRTEFLSGISHELKTPIALIQGYAEGLKDNLHSEQKEREYYCDVIMDEASKMNEMVKKLLVLNHMEYDNHNMTVERFNMEELIVNYLANAEMILEQKNIGLITEFAENSFVWGDEFKIEEVFDNYFTNALHYVKEGREEKAMIKVSLSEGKNKIRVGVFNTGDPIPEEALGRVWEKFYKVDKARTREYGGSGIGLSIVKAIMDSMNQNYGVENRENGVFFWFELDKA